ncbi:hypothetical protein BC939DRAFT_478087 [Gamsiella multidivaricata]|uniref:uncharacterized protein n=1 Tax=Gamsiella multidivaricata TaxID=101098 RepID=UPI002220B615|nr:uncharacterized protein BC939DRAFT_478087 [Gamsiella multidivaricata]KAI7821900.1 hypothetical protein BC939DRAFT_478087 [Gamsiella multidivaricata]
MNTKQQNTGAIHHPGSAPAKQTSRPSPFGPFVQSKNYCFNTEPEGHDLSAHRSDLSLPRPSLSSHSIMISGTVSSPPTKLGSGLLNTSQHQHLGNNSKKNTSMSTSTNTSSLSDQTRNTSGIKSLAFRKTHSQPSPSHNETSPFEHTNTASHRSLKNSFKSKPSKHDQAPTQFDGAHPHHQINGNKQVDHSYYEFYASSAQPDSGVASFNAIFQQHPKNMHDERIMLEEWLQKRSSSLQLVWKRRWCVLRDDRLYYYRTNTDTKPLGVLHLADYSILTSGPEVSRKSKYAFRLSSSESIPHEHQHHMFHAETPQALDLWLDAIQAHINHALAHLEGTYSLLDQNQEGQGSGSVKGGRGSRRSRDNSLQSAGNEQSIIDKVLDRLQLEDPTLSDMNDPSTLIMPAHEHPTSSPSLSYQHPTQKSFKELQFSLDDNLDGWAPSASPTLNGSSSHGASTKPSLDSLPSQQRSPIVIRGVHPHRTLNYSGGSLTQSPTSSYTDQHSNYSSYTEFSLGGNSSGKTSGSYSRGTIQPLDHQGRSSLQQGRGANQGSFHSPSSSLTGHNSPQPHPRKNGQTICIDAGTNQQHHLGLLWMRDHHADTDDKFPHLFSFLLAGCVSPNTSSPNFLVSSPKMIGFGSSAAALASYTNASSSNHAMPSSPQTRCHRVDTNPLGSQRTESNASSGSISTINSCSADANGFSETVTENASAVTSIGEDPRKNSMTLSVTSGKKYCTDHDLPLMQIVDREENVTAATSPKKTKKLWNAYGGGGQPPVLEKANGGCGSGTSLGRKNVSQTLDTNSSMFQSLILVSAPSKKSSSSSGKQDHKGFSKSMSSLTKGSEGEAGDPLHLLLSPYSPASSSSKLVGFDQSTASLSSRSRMRSPSVSVLDEVLQSSSRSSTQKLHNNRQPYSSNLLAPKITTAPISLITNDWSTHVHNQRCQQQRCIDLELERIGRDSVGDVAKHIVAPDELAMAINQEVEERIQKQGLERFDRSQEEESRPVSIMRPATSPETDNVSDGNSEGRPTSAATSALVGVTESYVDVFKADLPAHDTGKEDVQGNAVQKNDSGSSPNDEAHEILLSAFAATASAPESTCSSSFSGRTEGAVDNAVIGAVRVKSPPTVSVVTGDSLRSPIGRPLTESPRSSTSPVLPPALPRRSPFRSAPIPAINQL